MANTSDETLTVHDFTGLKCPLPVLKARRALSQSDDGTQLIFIADDPAAPLDFAHFCETSGHRLLAQETKADKFYFTIKKQA